MGKTTIKQKSNNFVITNKLTNEEAINEREINNIAIGLIENLIPVSKVRSFRGQVLKCTITNKIPLKSYFSEGAITKEKFLNITSKIIEVVKQCEKNLMNVNNLMLQSEYIFIDPNTKNITCIFWPIVSIHKTNNLYTFFSELPYSAVFSKDEDLDYVSTYLQYFNAKTFSLNTFEEMINRLSEQQVGNQPVNTEDSIGSSLPFNRVKVEQHNENSGIYGTVNKHSIISNTTTEESKICSNCEEVYTINAQFCGNCGYPLSRIQPSILVNIQNHITPNNNSTATQNGYMESIKNNINSISETTVLGGEESGGTTVLGIDDDQPTFPYLIREKTEEKIIVNKPSFRIGKEQSYCDYFISDNNAISRSHADIITKADRYFIIDNNSTNKTYVNNEVIPVKQEVEVFSGTILRLANEQFVFYI